MNADYVLSTQCSDRCSLEIRVDGELQEGIRFSDIEQTAGIVKAKRVVYRVVSYRPPPTPSPKEVRLGGTRFTILHGILRTYQVLHPIMAVVALLAYLLLTILRNPAAQRRQALDRAHRPRHPGGSEDCHDLTL